MDEKVWIHLSAIVLCALVFGIGLTFPAELQRTAWISGFGFLALLSLIFIIALPLIARVWRDRIAFKAVAERRWIGIWTFVFALLHVLLVTNAPFDWTVVLMALSVQDPFLTLGLVAFILLVPLLLTSNDYSMRALGANWKRLHLLIYPITAIVVAHFLGIGQIIAKNQILAWGVAVVFVLVLVFKFFWKK